VQRKVIKEEEEDGGESGSEELSGEEYDCQEINILFPDKV
jgi:hypothetical protein